MDLSAQDALPRFIMRTSRRHGIGCRVGKQTLWKTGKDGKKMHQYMERYDRNSQEIFILAVSDLNDVEELATPLTTCGHYVLSRKSAIHEAWWNSDGLSLRCTGGLHPATCMSKCARQCTIHTHRLWSKLFFFQMFHMYVCYKYIYIYINMYVCMYECV